MPPEPPALLLVGAGGHARACIDVIEQHGGFRIAGLVGAADQVGTEILGYLVFADDGGLASLAARHRHAIVTVGQIKTPQPRIEIFDRLGRLGYHMPAIVSPRAHVSRHAFIGAGTIVMHGAIVNAGARVGRNCIVNSQALIEHDAIVGDHCHLSTGSVLNGGVRVGDGTFIGSNSCVRQSLVIGERVVIGMGQRVLADCADGACLPPEGLAP